MIVGAFSIFSCNLCTRPLSEHRSLGAIGCPRIEVHFLPVASVAELNNNRRCLWLFIGIDSFYDFRCLITGNSHCAKFGCFLEVKLNRIRFGRSGRCCRIRTIGCVVNRCLSAYRHTYGSNRNIDTRIFIFELSGLRADCYAERHFNLTTFRINLLATACPFIAYITIGL